MSNETHPRFQKWKVILRRLLAIFTSLGILSLVFVSFYVFQTIRSVNLSLYRDEFNLTDAPWHSKEKASGGILESDSFVNLEDLESFLLFADPETVFSPKNWVEKKISLGELKYDEKSKNRLIVQKEIILPPLISNYCQTIYCIQLPMHFSKIPAGIVKGLIGIEDYRYLDHVGIDFRSILRALLTDIAAMRFVQGGSTLTQQLVKNLFLTNEKSWSRKFKEAILSIYIEARFSKEQILSAYLNEVIWGGLQGIRLKGIYTASLFYFGKRADELSHYEMAILVSLLKGPNYFHPIRHLERIKLRANFVYGKLLELGIAAGGKYSESWSDKKWEAWNEELVKRERTQAYKTLWEVIESKSDAIEKFEQYVFHLAVLKTKLMLSDKTSGKDIAIKAVLGSPISGDKELNNILFSYYSKFERSKDLAIQNELHQVGSILKPIIYSIFLDHEKSWEMKVSTGEIELKLKSGLWSPGEASEDTQEEMTLLETLKKSKNRPLIRLAQEIGFDQIEKELERILPNLKKPLAEYPAQLIGSVEYSVGEVFNIFSRFIKKECERVNKLKSEQIFEDLFYSPFEDSVLFKLSDPTETTIKYVVLDPLKNLRFFGKTGTTNDGLDNWFVSFDGRKLAVIWFGLEGNRIQQKLQVSGASSAFRIYQTYMLSRGKRFNEFDCSLFEQESPVI